MTEESRSTTEDRDRWQSSLVVWLVGSTLVFACIPILLSSLHPHTAGLSAFRAGIVSLTFAALVWALRAATPLAAFFGGLVCLLVILGTERGTRMSELHSGLAPLTVLFLVTFCATRAGRARKAVLGLVEPRQGRNAAQVLANLGAAGLAMLPGFFWLALDSNAPQIMLLGVLTEATADTVSSEIGAAFGGTPYLITTLRRVPPGTDGAISRVGTLAGAVAAVLVAVVGMAAMSLTLRQSFAGFLGGLVGLFADSLLGATVERRGWLGNDLVNFLSTCVGGAVALAICSGFHPGGCS